MSQEIRQPVRQEWREFLDTITRDREGHRVTVEVVTAELGSQVQVDNDPLAYIQYDDKDDAVIVAVSTPGSDDPALEHIVESPWKILFDPPAPAAVRSIDIEGSDGSHTLVTFHDRESSPDA